ncbi:hypothetical protein AB6A40_010530 [Gnathostoma spinigerum]|uniref:Uncharacterized protein n=1 Tax=Gnathostoma spinigerum TaxID=75299 RepID=A0ABD6EWU2_9BILA
MIALPAASVPVYAACTGIAPSSSMSHLNALMTSLNVSKVSLNAMICQESTEGTVANMKRCITSLKKNIFCNYPLDMQNRCIVEARQIEIDFASLTNQSFCVRITAPNGERSHLMEFLIYGQTDCFTPKKEGCGHGIWTFEVLRFNEQR